MQPCRVERRGSRRSVRQRSSMCVQISNTLTVNAVVIRVSSMWNLIRRRRPSVSSVVTWSQTVADTSSHLATVSAKLALYSAAHRGLGHCQMVVFERIVDRVVPQAELATEVQVDLEKVGDELRDTPTVWLDDCSAVGIRQHRLEFARRSVRTPHAGFARTPPPSDSIACPPGRTAVAACTTRSPSDRGGATAEASASRPRSSSLLSVMSGLRAALPAC